MPSSGGSPDSMGGGIPGDGAGYVPGHMPGGRAPGGSSGSPASVMYSTTRDQITSGKGPIKRKRQNKNGRNSSLSLF